MNTPAPVPLSEILLGAIERQLQEQTAAARINIEAMRPREFDAFFTALKTAARPTYEPLAVYCCSFPHRAAAGIREAAAGIVSRTIQAHILKQTAQ